MANYLLVVRARGTHPALDPELNRLSSGLPGERFQTELRTGWGITWFSQDAAEDLLRHSSGLFTGFAVDDRAETIHFSARGWDVRTPNSGGRELPGCYVRVSWDDHQLRLDGDLYRSMPVFVTKAPGLLLVSDSAYVLMCLRRRLNLSTSLDTEVAESMLWDNSMSAQLLGPRTLVREIQYVTVCGSVHLDLDRPDDESSVTYRPVREVFGDFSSNYTQELRIAAVRIASLITTVAHMGPEHARLALSGGKDSRICLAAVLLSPSARQLARYSCTNTNAQHQRDFEVVAELSEEFGFSLATPTQTSSSPQRLWRYPNPSALWVSDHAFCYFPFKMQSYALREKGPFAIAGFGSELYKGNYGLRPLSAIIESIARTDPLAAMAVDAISTEALENVGVSRESHLSAEWHYLLLRNALHGSRFVPTTKFGLRPLQQANLVGLSKLPLAERPEGMIGGHQIPDDLLTVLSPALATRPFDRTAKNRTPAQVTERLSELGGPVVPSDLTTYRICGSPQAVSGGPLSSLMRLLDTDRFHGALSRAGVAKMVTDAAGIVEDAEVSEAWFHRARLAPAEILDESIPVGHARGSLGRLVSLAEVLR